MTDQTHAEDSADFRNACITLIRKFEEIDRRRRSPQLYEVMRNIYLTISAHTHITSEAFRAIHAPYGRTPDKVMREKRLKETRK